MVIQIPNLVIINSNNNNSSKKFLEKKNFNFDNFIAKIHFDYKVKIIYFQF